MSRLLSLYLDDASSGLNKDEVTSSDPEAFKYFFLYTAFTVDNRNMIFILNDISFIPFYWSELEDTSIIENRGLFELYE